MIPIPNVPAPTPLSAGTQIYICKGIPWDRQYKHVRLFGSKSACLSFVQGKSIYSTTIAKPVRNNSVKIPLTSTQIISECNYIAYNNTNLNNFWIFGFITDINYTSTGVTEIFFEIDFFQTYFYDCKLQKCYVERHHWNRADDKIGANTLPEPVQEGYIQYYRSKEFNFGEEGGKMDTSVLMFLSDKEALEIASDEPKLIGNVFSGLYYIHGTAEQMTQWVKEIVNKGKADAITAMYMCPNFCNGNKTEYLEMNINEAYGSLPAFKNNKMYTYPFCYVEVQMYGVGEFKLYYEMTSSHNINVAIHGSMAPFPEVIAYANTYDGGQTRNLKHSLTFNSFPTCAVANDTYAQYLNSNGLSNAFSVAMSGMSLATGLLTSGGNPLSVVGNVTSALQGLGNVATSNLTAMRQVNTTTGTMGTGGSLYGMEELKVKAVQFGWDENSAKAADDFMSVFGYTTNAVVMPNLNSRNKFNYIKTSDCNISGNIGYIALEKLNSIFNSGVFIWHVNDVGNFDIEGNG